MHSCEPIAFLVFPVSSKLTRMQNQIKKLVEGCDNFIGLFPGEYGVPEIIVSENLRHSSLSILGDAAENFAHYMRDCTLPIPASRLITSRLMRVLTNIGASDSMGTRSSTGKKSIVALDNPVPTASISYPFQRPVKRHRSGTTSGRESGNFRPARSERRLRVVNEAPALQIRVDDRDRLEGWFKEAFVAMQQVACRIIAKVWIKRIHPRKVGSQQGCTAWSAKADSCSNLLTPIMAACHAVRAKIRSGHDRLIGHLVRFYLDPRESSLQV